MCVYLRANFQLSSIILTSFKQGGRGRGNFTLSLTSQSVPLKSPPKLGLMKCILFKIQYVGKSKFLFNLSLNSHRKDVNNPKAIPACHHFKIHGHNFMKRAKFTLKGQLTNIANVSKDTLRLRLKRREDFWIIKIETLDPKGINQELNI